MAELSDFAILVIRLGFLALLWLFVLSVVTVLRRDLFGGRRAGAEPGRRGGMEPARRGGMEPARRGDLAGAPAGAGRRSGRGAASAASAAPPPPPPADGRPRTLVVTGGELAGRTVPLGPEPITIGRAPDSTLPLHDQYASTRHARLYAADGQWLVEDLGSTNGTFLDRAKVTAPTPIPLGVPVRIGKTVLELRS